MISLNAKQINHGQSEVWAEGGNLSLVATNAVRNCLQERLGPETFNQVWGAYPAVGAEAVSFQVPEQMAPKYKLIR